MTLSDDFEDFIDLLNKYKVEYMIVGGYAMAFHGKPRFYRRLGYMDKYF